MEEIIKLKEIASTRKLHLEIESLFGFSGEEKITIANFIKSIGEKTNSLHDFNLELLKIDINLNEMQVEKLYKIIGEFKENSLNNLNFSTTINNNKKTNCLSIPNSVMSTSNKDLKYMERSRSHSKENKSSKITKEPINKYSKYQLRYSDIHIDSYLKGTIVKLNLPHCTIAIHNSKNINGFSYLKLKKSEENKILTGDEVLAKVNKITSNSIK
jgi:hypothetical protein